MSELKRVREEMQFEWTAHDFMKGMDDEDEYRFYISPSFDFDASMFCLKLGGFFLKNPDSSTLGAIRVKTNDSQRSNLPIQCTFALKNPNGIMEELGVKILKADEREIKSSFTKLSNVMRQQVRQRTLKVPAITFTIKVELLYDLDEAQFKRLNKENELSQNFKELFENMLNSDIMISVRGREFQAHKAILIARSKAIAGMFQDETSEKQTEIIKIDCDPGTFPAFLEYLYCGKLEELSLQSTLHLYETSRKYNEMELNKFCVEVLLKNMTVEMFCDIVSLASKYDDPKLMSGSEKFFLENSKDITKTFAWYYFSKNNSQLSNKLINETKEISKEKFANMVAEAEYLSFIKKITS